MNDEEEVQRDRWRLSTVMLKSDEKQWTGKLLKKRPMQIRTSVADKLLAIIVMRLASPRKWQKYLVEDLYEGPMDDTAANATRACDTAGPMMRYVSKIVFTSDKDRLYVRPRVQRHRRIGTEGQDPVSALHVGQQRKLQHERSRGVVRRDRCGHTADMAHETVDEPVPQISDKDQRHWQDDSSGTSLGTCRETGCEHPRSAVEVESQSPCAGCMLSNGTVVSGQKVRIQGSYYHPGENDYRFSWSRRKCFSN